MPQADFLRSAIQPVNDYVSVVLASHQWHPKLIGASVGLLEVGETAVLVGALSAAFAGLRAATVAVDERRRDGWRATDALFAAAAVLAVALFVWSVRIPSPEISTLFARWDHLTFCALMGYALSRASADVRKWTLSAFSVYFMLHHCGALPFAVVMGGALLGYALLRVPAAERPWPTAVLQGAVLLGIVGATWVMRSRNLLEALRAQGAFAFVLLRHISFVVEARRGRSARLTDYLCYMLFYPSFIGASEIYSEFSDRNLAAQTNYDYRAAAIKLIVGQLQFWASFQIEVSSSQVLQIRQTPLLWLSVLVLFVRAALFVMGLWSTIEGVALLYGFRLRPNFAGILTCENPAQFWHSWRGTMTNWLVHYVYIPLGGNRRRQYRNIFGAFVVSTAWHCMGMPFFTPRPVVMDFAPIALWGALNACAVVGYVAVRRRGVRVLPAQTPTLVRRGVKILLTACVSTFTVTLLDFRPNTTALFLPFLRSLLGLG